MCRKLWGGASEWTRSSFAAAGSSQAERGREQGFCRSAAAADRRVGRDGQDTAETIRLLDKLLLLQQVREQERAEILDEISEAS